MGFLQDLAAAAIRAQVTAALRADCPPELRDDLEELLANAAAVAAIQKAVTGALSSGQALAAEALEPLGLRPELAAFLQRTANAKLPQRG
ncbi:MAG: hypothetical protein ACI4OS_05220 [Akkermansia sp.]